VVTSVASLSGSDDDDITIHAVPQVRITSSGMGNVLAPGGDRELLLTITDPLGADFHAELLISDSDRRIIERRSVTSAAIDTIARVPVDHLPPGLYHARLNVVAKGAPVILRDLTFALPAGRIGIATTRRWRALTSVKPAAVAMPP